MGEDRDSSAIEKGSGSRDGSASGDAGAEPRVDAGAHDPRAWRIACSPPVVRRATRFMIVVGGILVAINHGDALLLGDIDGNRLAKIVLTPIVPYVVSTLSSVAAIRDASRTLATPSESTD